MIVRLDGKELNDTPALLAALCDSFGFQVRNRDALVDLLTHLDDKKTGKGSVRPGQVVTIAVSGASPQMKALSEIAAFVNWRRLEKGQPPILALAHDV